MDRNRACSIIGKSLLATVALLVCESKEALAQPARRMVYNSMTQQMEPEVRTRRLATWTPSERTTKVKKAVYQELIDSVPSDSEPSDSDHRDSTPSNAQPKRVKQKKSEPDFLVEPASYEGEEYYESYPADSGPMSMGCGDVCTGCCDDTCTGCGDCVTYSPGQSLYVGFEAAIVKPRFENNEAFTVMASDGALFETFNEIHFDYDMEFTPRVFVGWQRCDGIGLRATWWQFDNSAGNLSANPPANGFGEIALPPFGDVDISSNIGTDTFTAASELNAYSLDLEATKQTMFSSWSFGVGGGVRYASAEQRYFAQVRETGNVLRDQVDFRHSIEGIGPTISIDAYRPWTRQIGTFCKARGSVLFGDGESRLSAGEDLDVMNSFNTTRNTGRDDLLSIAEIQVGIRCQASPHRRRAIKPFVVCAFEGQIWNGAGNATSEEGNLGFFGFTTGCGFNW
jgi:hypothetical protein